MLGSVHGQNTFRISPSGLDGNSGKDSGGSANPWKSIGRLNQGIDNGEVQPGDNILFERGAEYRGEIDLDVGNSSLGGVVIADYGSGAKPIILGTETISSWNQSGGNSYHEASVGQDVSAVYVNGDLVNLARYPNSGYLDLSKTVTYSQLEDSGLPQMGNGYWDGANLRIRSSRWTWESIEIASTVDQGNTVVINLAHDLDQGPPPNKLPSSFNWRYYMDGLFKFLDGENEWYWDAGVLYLIAPGQQNPNALDVEASVYENGIHSFNGVSNLTIQNLDFRRQGSNGVNIITDPASPAINSQVRVLNCDFSKQGHTAIQVSGYDALIKDNFITDARGRGINCGYKAGQGSKKEMYNSTVSHNHVVNTGLHPGLGVSGQNGQTAIHTVKDGENIDIEYNLIENTGYGGLSIYVKKSRVRFNRVYNSCLGLDDGGGIYAFSLGADSTEIAYNIVDGVKGNDETVHNGKKNKFPAHGLYFDQASQNMDVHHNTVINSAKSGIFINIGSEGHQVYENVFYDSQGEAIMMKGKSTTFDGNICYALDKDVESVRLLGTKPEKYILRGTYVNNVFGNPYAAYTMVVDDELYPVTGIYSLDQWQDFLPGQANSTNVLLPFQWTQENLQNLEVDQEIGTDVVVNGDFSNGTNGWAFTNGGSGSVNSGSLQVSGGGVESATGIAVGDPSQDKYYRLRFTVSSTGFEQLDLSLANAGQGAYEYPLSTTPRTYERIFTVSGSYSGAKIQFSAATGDFILDDVSLVEVSVLDHDSTCKSHIFVNATNQVKTAAQVLAGDGNTCNYAAGWVDLNNNPVDLSTIQIDSFHSQIFVYTGVDSLPPDTIVDPPSDSVRILYVVMDQNAPSTSETAVHDHIESVIGYTVDYISDDQSQSSSAVGYDLVLISGEVAPSQVQSKFEAISQPVMLLRPQLLDDMSMGLTGGNTTLSDTDVEMDAGNLSHPMAAGLSGTVTVSSTGVKFGKINTGSLMPGVIQIAHLPNTVAQTVFGYDVSPYGNGAGRRSAFLMNIRDADKLNADGWLIFEKVLCWSLGTNCEAVAASGPPTACFTLTTASPNLCAAVDFDASCSYTADPSDYIVNYNWSFGSAFGLSTSNTTASFGYASAGTYTVSLTVTDNNGLSNSTSQTITVAASPKILLMTFGSSMTTGEQDLYNRLLDSYCDVVVREDDDAAAIASGQDALDINTVDLVIVSAWCADSKIGTHFRDLAVPALILSPFIYDNMEMSLSNGTANGQTAIFIEDAAHPMANGNPQDTLHIANPGQKIAKGNPNANAALVASTGKTSGGSSAVFGYESGAVMYNATTAPARRTGFFVNKNAFSLLSNDALEMLDQAICWTLGACGGGNKSFPAPSEQLTWKVYPNPASQELNVDLGEWAAQKRAEFRLFNLQGQHVGEWTSESAHTSLDLAAQGLPQGMYLLQIRTDGQERVFRVAYRP